MPEKTSRSVRWLFVLFAVVMLWALWSSLISGDSEESEEISVTRLYAAMEAGEIGSISVNRKDFSVTGEFTNGKKFYTQVADIEELEKKAVAKAVEFKTEKSSWWDRLGGAAFSIIFYIALIFLVLWWFSSMAKKSGQAGQIGILPKEKSLQAEKSSARFGDIAGCDEVKEDVAEILDFLKNPSRYSAMGAKVPRGVLLTGAPGTGKTLLAKALSGEADVPMFSCAGPEFMEMFVGVGARRVRELFAQAKRVAPCIIFIDEIYALGARRRSSELPSHAEHEQTLNQLLSSMDGFRENDNIVVVAATNQPEVLDPALLRSGRFDRKIIINLPDIKGREEILKIHSRNKKVSGDLEFSEIARATPGLSGAELENILNEAAILAVRRNSPFIAYDDVMEAVDKVSCGPKRKGRIIPKHELERKSIHEAGHAAVAYFTEGVGAVQKVTIVERGRMGGSTHLLPEYEQSLFTRKYLMNYLEVLMAGAAAEEAFLGDLSSGAHSDFERATEIAKSVICQFGMGEAVGKMVIARKSEFLSGKQLLDCSSATQRLVEKEIKKILDEALTSAKRKIREQYDKTKALYEKLLEKETLNAEEIKAILNSSPA